VIFSPVTDVKMLGRLDRSFTRAVLSAFRRRFPQVHHTEKCPSIKNQSLQITLAYFHPINSHIFPSYRVQLCPMKAGAIPFAWRYPTKTSSSTPIQARLRWFLLLSCHKVQQRTFHHFLRRVSRKAARPQLHCVGRCGGNRPQSAALRDPYPATAVQMV
jgi:hypothetical protein